jgi:Spy/CpxP family protein refolding chaperone
MMNSPKESRRGVSPRLLAGIVLVLVGLLGAVAGMALDRAVLSPCAGERAAGREHGRVPWWARSGEEHQERWKRVSESLSLSPEQSAAIDSILAEQTRELEAVRETAEPEFRSILQVTRDRIDAVLTAGQKAQLEEQRLKHREERRSRGGRD